MCGVIGTTSQKDTAIFFDCLLSGLNAVQASLYEGKREREIESKRLPPVRKREGDREKEVDQ